MVEVKRIKRIISKPQYLKRIFSKNEIAYCNRYKNKEERFAARFAAKEAYIKCTGGKKIPKMRDIEVRNSLSGKPELYVCGRKVRCSLSITHCGGYAVAVCVI